MIREIIKVGGQSYVAATSTRLDDRTRTLKHGDSFAVFDRYGDIQSIGLGEQGIYHQDTRFLSRLDLRIGDGHRPVLLNSTVKEDNSLLTVDLTTPDIYQGDKLVVPQDTVYITRAKLLWNSVCHEHLRFVNYGDNPINITFVFEFDADFADIFEVRGVTREKRGQKLEPIIENNSITLAYHGLDDVIRKTRLDFQFEDAKLSANDIHFNISLAPHEEQNLYLTVNCDSINQLQSIATYSASLENARCELKDDRSKDCVIRTSNEQFNDWLNRSAADLHLLISDTPEGPYPYAGVPWFSTPFGRDGIITALQYLWVNPSVARGVLAYLATNQATEEDPTRDAEPGKILHETRKGEMATLGEVPFAKYYGSVDSTPLFIVLAGAYFERTGDRAFIASIWPNIEAALKWIDEYGDLDKDGFIEYARKTPNGLEQQGWKDSNDSVFHQDGSPAQGAIALCEVQGYVYDAWVKAADMAEMRGDSAKAKLLTQKANKLKTHFNETFWCEEISTYAIALDGDKMPCMVRSSNAGHCLYSGIATPEYAQRIAHTLTEEHSFSGWGIRTIANTETRYNPMSYHNGAIWPHDNALITMGFARYGLHEQVNKVTAGLFDASLFLDLHRMPELFCGFERRPGGGPTLYPVACAPQAWASTVAFSCLQSCLGLSIQGGPQPRIGFTNPELPLFLDRVEIKNLQVDDTSVDILIRRYENDAGIIVLRRDGNIEVTVVK